MSFYNMDLKTYNPKLPVASYYKKIPCFGRTKVMYLTNNLVTVAEKVAKGWSFSRIKNGFYLQAPELWLVDISEPAKIYYYSNSAINNYAYFLYLKSKTDEELISLIKKLLNDGQEVFMSEGESLELEVRVILEDKSTSGNLMFDLYSEFLQSKEYKKYFKEAGKLINKSKSIKIQKNRDIIDYSPKVSKLFLEITKYYSLINLGKRDLFSYDFIPELEPQVELTFGDADIFIFVPWGCFKYIGNFISEKTVDKVMLWETHLFKYEVHEHKFRKKSLRDKKVIIFDKGYTGGTLNKMAGLVVAKGGIPIKVAIFPKSRLAIKNSDYIFFGDKLIKSSEVDISQPDYYKTLYKRVFA